MVSMQINCVTHIRSSSYSIDNIGNEPAAAIKASLKVNEALAGLPETAKEKGGHGRLPLHLALKCGASDAKVKRLLQAYPEARKEKDEKALLPLSYAVEGGASAWIVQELLAADMPFRVKDGSPVDHYGSWAICVAASSEVAAEAICWILAADSDDPPGLGFGAHIHELVNVLDDQKRTALAISATGPREAINAHLLFCGRYELIIGAPEHRSATSVVLRALDRGEKTDYGKVFDDADKDGNGTLDRQEVREALQDLGFDFLDEKQARG